MLAVCQACQFFLPDIRGHHVLVRSDKHVCGVIHKTPGRSRLVVTLHAGERPSCVGTEQSALAEGNACAGQTEPRSRHVVEERLFRGMDASPARGSENLGKLWQGSISPNRSATAGTQTSQGTTAQVSINSPPLEEPTVGVTIIPAANSRPVTNSLETGPPLSSERHDMGSTAWAMGPACVAARREPFSLPERVLNTMAEARAPSTRCLYARKWSFFLAWCQDRNLEPVTSEVSVVLSFQQEMLDKQRSSSTIKVYTAAIVAFHTPVWNRAPFEPLQSSSLRVLLLKTALLLALASVKRVGDLQALSINLHQFQA